MTTKYIEYKHNNTGTSSCKCIVISNLHYFNSSTKCKKTVSLQYSFGLAVEIGSWFSKLVSFNWVRNKDFISLILKKNISRHVILDVLTYERNIYDKQQHRSTQYVKNSIRTSISFKSILLWRFCIIFITHAK